MVYILLERLFLVVFKWFQLKVTVQQRWRTIQKSRQDSVKGNCNCLIEVKFTVIKG